MSSTLIDHPTTPKKPEPSPSAPAKAAAPARRDWRLVVVVCLLLGISGAVRYWREFQFLQIKNQSEAPPFPLKELPMVLGSWRALEGVETTLDPEIARVAGSSDHVLRTYVDDETGERATVLVLYGLAPLVWGHTPEACYPAVGFQPLVAPRNAPVALANGTTVPFREALYGKSLGGASTYHEVYYSFRNAGEWRPEMGSRWKRFRNHPGMFKIQIERRVKTAELGDGVCHDLMAGLVEAIEKRALDSPIPLASAPLAAE